jgi:uncharacterized protein (TIGR03067 family)
MLRTLFSLLVASAVSAAVFAADSELDKLQGKWETNRTTEEGQKVTQTIELKKDKMTFKMIDSSGSTVFAATATIKPQKAGAFSAFTISNIKAGRDEDSLEDADGERSYVYLFANETLTIVSNIDEERERPPLLDVYKKVTAK